MMLRFGSEFLSQNFDLKINIFLSFFSLDPVPFFLYPLDNYLKIFFFNILKNFIFNGQRRALQLVLYILMILQVLKFGNTATLIWSQFSDFVEIPGRKVIFMLKYQKFTPSGCKEKGLENMNLCKNSIPLVKISWISVLNYLCI